uniref:NUC173 domain-containing protein n=2 Tax=Mesocestoides corti TaxID=53468 RepID=A0A5K3FL93_MESCO
MSVSGETFASWATHVTRCSNPTFNRVLNRLWSNPQLQKNVLAVLTGVTKLIQSRGGTESAAEYYAALLSLLNTNSSTKAAEAYLLRLVVSKAVPVSLLRKTCSEASKTITNVLSAALQEEPLDVSMCKSLLVALGRVLVAQPSEDWASESVRHNFRILLQFTDNENATLRKAAHRIISELLASTLSREDGFHPVCRQTMNYTCRLIQQETSHLSGLIRITDGACSRLLHSLNLMKSILWLVPEKDVKAGCECTLELTAFNNSLVVKSSFDCLRTLFQARVKDSSLPLDTAGKLMTALLTCRPRDSTSVDSEALQKDSETVIAWLECLSAGVGYLTTLAVENRDNTSTLSASHVAVEHLDHLIRTALNIVVTSPLPSLRDSVKRLLVNITQNYLNEQLQSCDLLTQRPRLLSELCTSLQNALSLARRETWPNLLYIASHLIYVWAMATVVGNSVDYSLPDEVTGLLNRVASLRDASTDSIEGLVDTGGVDETALVGELDRFILTSMESWGIEPVLRDALSLEPLVAELESGSVELRRSWILPLIARVHPARSCSLAFFHASVLPLADRAVTVAKAAANQTFKRQIGGGGGRFVPLSAILNAAVQMARQLWFTLTAFTRRPPTRWADLMDSGLGGRLVAGLLTAKAVRPVILSALRRLIAFADSEESVAVMRSGAKQMVPRILSMFEEQDSTNDQQLKQQLHTTLAVFLPLLTPKMLSVPSEMAYKKLVATKKPIYMEILAVIVPNLSSDQIQTILHHLEGYFAPEYRESRAIKKCAYRLLEAVLASSNPPAKDFVASNLTSLTAFMQRVAPPLLYVEEAEEHDRLSSTMAALALSKKDRKTLVASTPWKVRLRILRMLLRAHVERQAQAEAPSHDVEDFINTFMPEVPPCLGSLNSVVRVVAEKLLVDMVLSSAGSLPQEHEGLGVRLPRPPSSEAPHDDDKMEEEEEEDDDEEDEDEEEEEESIRDGSDSEHSYAPTEIASVCTAITTTGMNPVAAAKTCAGLRGILSRLWPLIMEATPESVKSSTTSQLLRLEVTAKAVCRLLSNLHLRRSLMTDLQATEEGQDTSAAALVLSNANLASHSLVQLPSKQLASLGLQISRLLIAFVGHSVYVSDIVMSIHKVHAAHKRSLRFLIKAIVGKLLKKVSVQALQSLMNAEYHKMIRNSAKIQLRRDRKRKSEGKKGAANRLPGDDDDDDDVDDDGVSNVSAHSRRVPSVSGASFKSFGSALSLSKRIHVQGFNEILAGSSDEDEANAPAQESSKTVATKAAPEPPRRRPGLAAELERAASVAGLSRRSRRLFGSRSGGGGDGDAVDSSSDDDDAATTRRVGVAGEGTQGHKRRRSSAAGLEPMTYLVEDAEDEVLDLADPEALARHLTVAPSAQHARRALAAHRGDGGVATTKRKRARLTSLASAAAFPTTADGKLIINEDGAGNPENDAWLLDDDAGSSGHLPAHLSQLAETKVPSKRANQIRHSGSVYRSARARGDMKKPGLPDPFAYMPLGAGVPAKSRKGKGAVAERRALLRSLGAGKQKRKKLPRTSSVGKSVGKRQRHRMKK